MSESKVETFLTEENINNLAAYTLNCCQDAGDMGHVDAEYQEWRNRYKVSLGLITWHISNDFMPKFWLFLSQGEEGWDKIVDKIEAEDGTINEFVAPLLSSIEEVMVGYEPDQNDPFYKLLGIDFENVDKRLEGLTTAGAGVIRDLAKTINKELDLVNKDTDLVKDFDGILTFDTNLGKDFKLSLCFDKIAPINEEGIGMVMRTPITDEDGEKYLRGTYPKVLTKLEYMNSLVTGLFESKAVRESEYLLGYAANAVDVLLTKAFLNQIITYIQFGGIDDWRVQGKDTPNNKACFEILDAELENVIKLLDELPKGEGVDLHSLDIDTLAAFGRNNDNRVVTPAVQGFTEQKLLSRYSKGFERLFAIRLSMSDNAHFFRA